MNTLLRNLFLFKGIDFEKIDKKYSVVKETKQFEYENGQLVLAANGKTRGIFIVSEGEGCIVAVSKKHNAPLRHVVKGDTFGAANLYGAPLPHRTEVYACGKLKVLMLPPELIDRLIENEGAVALNYIKFLSDRVSFLNRKISAFSAGSAEEKLALFLLSLPIENGCVQLTESYTEIAKMLDLGRASLYRSIESLENADIIRRNGRTVYIDDRLSLLEMIN